MMRCTIYPYVIAFLVRLLLKGVLVGGLGLGLGIQE